MCAGGPGIAPGSVLGRIRVLVEDGALLYLTGHGAAIDGYADSVG